MAECCVVLHQISHEHLKKWPQSLSLLQFGRSSPLKSHVPSMYEMILVDKYAPGSVLLLC